jgi:hypothetical protein
MRFRCISFQLASEIQGSGFAGRRGIPRHEKTKVFISGKTAKIEK